MKVLELKNLVKIYNDSEVKVKAVDGISLNFEQGEFAAIVGPSGSGKTTLLNLIGGLDSITEGEIIIDGTNISQLSSSKLIDFRLRNIGFVFQAYNLIPVLTAKENIEFIMELQGKTRKARTERAMELLNAVGLGERAESRPAKMSGSIARALANKPPIILADEPTANLDSKSTETLLDIMERLNKEENITFIFSTHDQRVVNKARRIITVEDGHVVSDEKRELSRQ